MSAKIQSNIDGTVSILNGLVEAITIGTGGEIAFPQAESWDFDGNDGYYKHHSGLLLQWGYRADAGTGMTISYNIPFTTRVFTVQCQMVRNAANYQNVTIASNYPTSLNGVYVYWDSVANGINWFAIGI